MIKKVKNMRDAANCLDVTKGDALLSKILISDITNEVSQFSEYAEDFHPELAGLFLVEAQSKLRVITKLLQAAESDIAKEYERLDEISTFVFDEVVRNTNTKKAASHGDDRA